MLAFLSYRAIAGVESADARRFRRGISLVHRGVRHVGWIEVAHAARRRALAVSLSPTLSRVVPQVLSRVRHAFDLGCDPAEIANALGPLAAGSPGVRVPGTFDGFEAGVRAIAGQQVSVRAMVTLLGRIAARFGEPLAVPAGGVSTTFPDAATLASVPAESLAALGMPQARARSIVALARAVADGLELSPGVDIDTTMARLVELPGIGPWTAQYIALRGLGWPDAFLPTDLGVKRALGETSVARIVARAEAWRPWRAYAVIHLWKGAAGAST
jgi:AraC family transcriptional regulator of adaptative response / DNA-3-methyladenine glycosylase II